jgi:hypothetical protein
MLARPWRQAYAIAGMRATASPLREFLMRSGYSVD